MARSSAQKLTTLEAWSASRYLQFESFASLHNKMPPRIPSAVGGLRQCLFRLPHLYTAEMSSTPRAAACSSTVTTQPPLPSARLLTLRSKIHRHPFKQPVKPPQPRHTLHTVRDARRPVVHHPQLVGPPRRQRRAEEGEDARGPARPHHLGQLRQADAALLEGRRRLRAPRPEPGRDAQVEKSLPPQEGRDGSVGH